MSRKEIVAHLQAGITQYFEASDVHHNIDDIVEDIVTQLDHTMMNLI
tara:strand:- start:528 stop:668 length:141 start_codon:yes stop_codon:yes gene_type:complete